MKICIDLHHRQLHEFVERKREQLFNQPIDFEPPGGQVDARRTVRVEDGPFLRPRLSRRNAILAPRVRTDNDVRLVYLFRRPRLLLLIFRIFDESVQEAHLFIGRVGLVRLFLGVDYGIDQRTFFIQERTQRLAKDSLRQ